MREGVYLWGNRRTDHIHPAGFTNICLPFSIPGSMLRNMHRVDVSVIRGSGRNGVPWGEMLLRITVARDLSPRYPRSKV